MLISICIPTYSRLEYLKKSVQSCLDQTYKHIEICVSQDPKKDGPDREIMEWCQEQAQKIPFFTYNLNINNLGLAGNWNECVQIASGKYMIIIGDDDILMPDFIQSLAEQLEAERADVAFSNQYFIDEEGRILHAYTEEANATYHRNDLPPGRVSDPVATVLNNSVPMSAALIRRDLLLKYPFDTSLNTPEFEVFLKIAVNGGSFTYHAEKLACYRVHPLAATSGGLTIDKLLRNVISIDVPSRYQKQKFDFVSSKLIPGINMSLRRGDKSLALAFMKSPYYPKNKMHIRLAQAMISTLPSWAIQRIL
ncbi:glycosyltransferase family 2 protein [Dyadobacter fanqingshengii]|uniref:Glycosyltransferase n=1 Tax=Dyadobacter fanqingshengii TaxID=2906443 RepID=A0A9X1PA42_9BACT|nr:glycosyltransferase family 2 protein [Dyadobacter fanqingshengii]MCF0039878.1 glycosyltransferase [Dyadobacter fanqingshengii]USJ38361.1 glycosyltransferase [Dyadobacter fanqingshengii]